MKKLILLLLLCVVSIRIAPLNRISPERRDQYEHAKAQEDEAIARAPAVVTSMCCICLDDLSAQLTKKLSCLHEFHAACLSTWVETHNNNSCPLCRIAANAAHAAVSPIVDIDAAPIRYVRRSIINEALAGVLPDDLVLALNQYVKLLLAIRKNNLPRVLELLDFPEINWFIQNPLNSSALHLATSLHGNIDIIEALLNRIEDDAIRVQFICLADRAAVGGLTALHWAARRGYLDIAQVLVLAVTDDEQRNQLINAPDLNGMTALHWAAQGGFFDIVQMLLQEGANANTVDRGGRTARDRAVSSRRNRAIVNILPPGGGCKRALREFWSKIQGYRV